VITEFSGYSLAGPVGGGRSHLNILLKHVHTAPAILSFGVYMAKDVISVDGQDVVVREDTAKAFRGVNWALASVIAFVAITAELFIIFTISASSDGEVKTPAEIEQR
jgi:hypothetical protein